MVELRDELTERLALVEAEVVNLERVLVLARESGFDDLVANITQEIAEVFLPGLTVMLCTVDGAERERVAAQLRRLQNCVG